MPEFRFSTSAKLVEIVGRRATTLAELLAGIRELDGSVIFHHTHHFALRRLHLVPQPPNEFAWWVDDAMRERELAERLLAVDMNEFESIRALRERLVGILEERLQAGPPPNPAPEGMAFHFLRTRSFVLPTPHVAGDLRGFRDALERVSLNSVYHHMFEVKLRLGRGANDFSYWMDTSLGERDLAASIARLDPYAFTLAALREAILDRVCERLGESRARGANGSRAS